MSGGKKKSKTPPTPASQIDPPHDNHKAGLGGRGRKREELNNTRRRRREGGGGCRCPNAVKRKKDLGEHAMPNKKGQQA